MSNRLAGNGRRTRRGSARNVAAPFKEQFMNVARIAMEYAAPITGFEAACVVSCHLALEAKAGRFDFAVPLTGDQLAERVQRRAREVLVKDWTEWDAIAQHRPDPYTELREYGPKLREYLDYKIPENEYLLRRLAGKPLTQEDHRWELLEQPPSDPDSDVGQVTLYMARLAGDEKVETRLVDDGAFFAKVWPLFRGDRETLRDLFHDSDGDRGDAEMYAADRAELLADTRPVGWSPTKAELCILWALLCDVQQQVTSLARLERTRRAYERAARNAERKDRWGNHGPVWYKPTMARAKELVLDLDVVEELAAS